MSAAALGVSGTDENSSISISTQSDANIAIKATETIE